MPIYEYVCEKCGAHIEKLQKVGEAPLKRCQKCGGKLEKIVSRTSFQLKGSGWYATDYSSKKGGSKDKEKSDAGTSDSVSTASSDKGAKKESGPSSKVS